ncbi:helix-turn-helix domain-containing protein [Cognaticolwellia mytili]|uniref:helix-turn-helix domain-containing protein n=1 Tax=Cognaticolwellia mytili TaxID=1888913 RepID=UPI000A16F3E0|nr:helix-turn-helix transcriptional regulator [Cognaticolwellia mytili]
MEINAFKVKNLRSEQHWTQQHLADACGISLRTVQRVERYGNASNETLMSLASVFNVEKKSLVLETEPVEVIEQVSAFNPKQQLIAATVAGAVIGASLMYLMMLIEI